MTRAYMTQEIQDGEIELQGVKRFASVVTLTQAPWVIIETLPVDNVREYGEILEDSLAALALLMVLLFIVELQILKKWRRSDDILNRDVLCHCGSRAAFSRILSDLENEYDADVTILYTDLNNFKTVNDTYGHDAGDKLLVLFSDALVRYFSELGFVSRIGGDEFTIMMTDAPEERILRQWELLEAQLKKENEKLAFDYAISASFGIATRKRGDTRPLRSIMAEADERMYENKKNLHGVHV